MRVCAVKGTKCASCDPSSRPRNPYFSFASTTMERPSGVSSASEDSCAASASSASVTPGAGMKREAWRLPKVMVPVLSSSSVFTSPAASTARPDMASTLCWIRRSMPAMPIAESSPPMVVGIRQTSSETSTKTVCGEPEYMANGCRVTTASRKMMVKSGEQNVERDLVGRLLALGAFDQRDHAIEEGFAGVRRDLDLDLVGEHARAAGNGGAIATGFADDRRGFAGDGRLVDRRDALDDVAVGRNEFAGRNHHDVAGAQLGAADLLDACRP